MRRFFFVTLLTITVVLPFAATSYASEQEDVANFAALKADAARGEAMAQFILGHIYEIDDPMTGPHDYTKAAEWLRKAAEQGHAGAQDHLGNLYEQGNGVPQDYQEAAKWYRKAAAQGLTDAQLALALMYDSGHGVPQNYSEAVQWYLKAADQGSANAQFLLGGMYQDGHGVPQDDAKAMQWLRKAAEQGYALAQFGIGTFYQHGTGVPKDDAEAAKWYRKAAEQGFVHAQTFLAMDYATGDGVPRDEAEAVKWYRKAAEQGDAYAQVRLGSMYENGWGVSNDFEIAYAWYSLAAMQQEEGASELRDNIVQKLTPDTLVTAQRLSKRYVADYQKRPDIAAFVAPTPRKQDDTLFRQQIPAEDTPRLQIRSVDSSLVRANGTGTQNDMRSKSSIQPMQHESDSVSRARLYLQWIANFAASCVLLVIYLIPPLVLRYVLLRRPVGKTAATILTILCLVIGNAVGSGLLQAARGYIPPLLDSEVLAIVPFLGVICAFRILREKTHETAGLESAT